MAAPANELQRAIYELLMSNAAVQALVQGRVYDQPSASGVQAPYISFGPSDEIEEDADCIEAASHSFQIDVWSEYQGGFKECKEVTHAVKRALHDVEADLATHALVEMRVVRRRHFRDPDGITTHGVVDVEAMIEERDG